MIYRTVTRPIFFGIEPEASHEDVLALLGAAGPILSRLNGPSPRSDAHPFDLPLDIVRLRRQPISPQGKVLSVRPTVGAHRCALAVLRRGSSVVPVMYRPENREAHAPS